MHGFFARKRNIAFFSSAVVFVAAAVVVIVLLGTGSIGGPVEAKQNIQSIEEIGGFHRWGETVSFGGVEVTLSSPVTDSKSPPPRQGQQLVDVLVALANHSKHAVVPDDALGFFIAVANGQAETGTGAAALPALSPVFSWNRVVEPGQTMQGYVAFAIASDDALTGVGVWYSDNQDSLSHELWGDDQTLQRFKGLQPEDRPTPADTLPMTTTTAVFYESVPSAP